MADRRYWQGDFDTPAGRLLDVDTGYDWVRPWIRPETRNSA